MIFEETFLCFKIRQVEQWDFKYFLLSFEEISFRIIETLIIMIFWRGIEIFFFFFRLEFDLFARNGIEFY